MDYQACQHKIKFTFTPYYGSAPLDYSTAAQTLQLTYHKTTLLYKHLKKKTTGLDPLAVRMTASDPQVPITSTDDPRLSLDVEGTVENKDGLYVFLHSFYCHCENLAFTLFLFKKVLDQ